MNILNSVDTSEAFTNDQHFGLLIFPRQNQTTRVILCDFQISGYICDNHEELVIELELLFSILTTAELSKYKYEDRQISTPLTGKNMREFLARNCSGSNRRLLRF